jgi:amino acid transporter
MGALAFAERGAMMPHAGGQYVYLREAYGPLTGFLWGWGEFWMMRTGSTAALAVAFSNAFYQSLAGYFEHTGWVRPSATDGVMCLDLLGAAVPLPWVLRGIAISAILLLTGVNVLGARWGGMMQNVTTFIKGGTLVALVVLPFLAGQYETANLTSTISPRTGLLVGFGAAMTAAFWAYDGWGNIGPVAEEVRDPQRNIPISLFLGMFILIALYLGATLAYHLVLTMGETASSVFVAASACQRMLGERGAAIASAAVMLSTFGALNSNVLVGPRVIFAMARDRLFLSPMARVHPRYHTPHVSILAEMAWAVLLILGSDLFSRVSAPGWVSALPRWLAQPLGESIGGMRSKPVFDVLTDFVIFGQFVFYLLAVAAVFVLRVRRPDLPRPYKTYGYPVLPSLFVVASAGFLLNMLLTSPVESSAGLLFIGLGAVAYLFRPRDGLVTGRGM